MALTDDNGGLGTTMLVQPSGGGVMPYPVYQQGGNGGAFGGEQSWWIILLVIILMAAGGWGNGNGGYQQGGYGGGQPIIIQDGAPGGGAVQRGFDQAAIMGGIGDINAGIHGIQNNLCSGFAGVNASINGGVNAIQQQIYGNTIAGLERSFAAQVAQMQGMNGIQSRIDDCCCENRLATEGLKATIVQENCADRYEAAQNTRDIIENANRNNQAILDKLCQLELDGVKQNYETRIAAIQNALDQERANNQGLRFAASQTQQNALIAQGFANEVDALYNRLQSCPVPTTPVYGRTPIFTCQGNNGGCGCGNGGF